MTIAPEVIAELLAIGEEAAAGQLTIATFTERLVDLVYRTGIAPALLSEYLTASGKRYAEGAADIAEEAKLAVQRMKGEM